MPGIFPIIMAVGALALVASKKKKKKGTSGGRMEPQDAPGSDWSPYEDEEGSNGGGGLSGGLVITARAVKKTEPKLKELGKICGTASERRTGVWSAYDQDGKCVVFWNQQSDSIMTAYIREELNKLGVSTKKACAADVWEADPFNPPHGGRWVPNPTKMKILKLALKRSYPQIPEKQTVRIKGKLKDIKLLPPGELAPYYVQMVWKFADSIYMREVCSYIPVT